MYSQFKEDTLRIQFENSNSYKIHSYNYISSPMVYQNRTKTVTNNVQITFSACMIKFYSYGFPETMITGTKSVTNNVGSYC